MHCFATWPLQSDAFIFQNKYNDTNPSDEHIKYMCIHALV